MKKGFAVWCYMNKKNPLVKGITMTNDIGLPREYQKVRLSDGSIKCFPIEQVFTSKEEYLSYIYATASPSTNV